MGQLEDQVRQLLEDRNISISQFAESIGIPKRTVYSALRNGLANSRLTTVIPIAEALHIDPMEIYYGRLTPVNNAAKSVPVPVFGAIAAGKPLEFEYAEGVFPIPASLHDKYPDAFMLRVEGESMNRVLPNGSYALIDPRKQADSPGKLYALAIDEHAATIKRIRILSNGLELQPDSDDPTFHPVILDNADPNAPTVRIIGCVVWHCPPLS